MSTTTTPKQKKMPSEPVSQLKITLGAAAVILVFIVGLGVQIANTASSQTAATALLTKDVEHLTDDVGEMKMTVKAMQHAQNGVTQANTAALALVGLKMENDDKRESADTATLKQLVASVAELRLELRELKMRIDK